MTILEKYSLHLPYGLIVGLSDEGKYNLDNEYPNEHQHKPCYLERFSFYDGDIYGEIEVIDSVRHYSFDFNSHSEIIPYLRNLSDLKKPITQKDYNNGEHFIPIVELNRILGYTEVKIVNFINSGIGYHINDGSSTALSFLTDIFPILQQLLKWHFAIGFEQGEYIEVTNENNPY